MSQYDHYTSIQLYELAGKSSGSLRNYLLRLLLQKEDSKEYVEELLNDDNKNPDIVRLLSPADTLRFATTLIKLLEEGDRFTKKIIISRIANTRDPLLVKALLKRVLDNREDVFIRKTAITALGNSADDNLVPALVRIFDELDDDSQLEIVIALGKIGNSEALSFLQKLSLVKTGPVGSRATKTLELLNDHETDEREKQEDMSVFKIWIRYPFSYPDTGQLCFFNDNRGNYNESKAGESELNMPFRFRIEKEMIVFVLGQGREDISGFTIEVGNTLHPYLGKIKCLILRFANRDISIKDVNITGSDYYYLYQDL